MKTDILLYFSEGAQAAADAVAENAQTQTDASETHDAEPAAQIDASDVQSEKNAVQTPQTEEALPDVRQLQHIADGRARMQDWLSQGEQLKAFYPSFSLQDEYNGNEEFARLLRAGVNVRQAYEVTHLPQILTAAMQYAARKASEKTAGAMRSGTMRPQENGLVDRKAGLPSAKGVESLTQADIIRILDRVGKGDKITF